MCLAQRGFQYEITFLVKSLMTHCFVVPGDWVVRYSMHGSVPSKDREGEITNRQSKRCDLISQRSIWFGETWEMPLLILLLK